MLTEAVPDVGLDIKFWGWESEAWWGGLCKVVKSRSCEGTSYSLVQTR